MKIEATPEEIAEFITELQTRLMEFDCTVESDDEKLEKFLSQIGLNRSKNSD